MALRDLGFSAVGETVYRALLREPGLPDAQLATAVGLDEPTVLAAVDELVELGVIKDAPDGRVVGDPAAGIGQLIEHCEDELMRRHRQVADTRSVVGELMSLHRRVEEDPRDSLAIERLDDLPAIRERLEELSFFTRSSVYAVQPGGPQSSASLDASRPLDQRAIRRRIEMRLIHEATVLDDELNRAYLRELVMGGAKVRVTRQHIDRMLIMDEQVAVVPVDPGDSKRGALIVRHPGLLAGFIDLFHRLWQDADELPWISDGAEPVTSPTVSEQDRRVLTLLASGCTDETSAREVGVSVRHLRRTISRLIAELGANSRFEAGVEAARRGWL
jgi:DNA-binding CsgD family transcriptional regulator/sugar-specific transcriptional regulator TrmB